MAERTMTARTRRVKILHVHDQVVLSVFAQRVPAGTVKEYYDICWSDLPEDVELISVHYDPERLAFAFLISHKSFEEIPIGDCVPSVKTMLMRYRIKLTKPQQNEIYSKTR